VDGFEAGERFFPPHKLFAFLGRSTCQTEVDQRPIDCVPDIYSVFHIFAAVCGFFVVKSNVRLQGSPGIAVITLLFTNVTRLYALVAVSPYAAAS